MILLALLFSRLMLSQDPDELMRHEVARINQIQPSVIRYVKSLQPSLLVSYNPAIVKTAQGMVFLAFRGARWKDDRNFFVWMTRNGTERQLEPYNPPYYALGDGGNCFSELQKVEDIRLIPFNQSVAMVYTQVTRSTGRNWFGHMALATLSLGQESKRLEITELLHLNWSKRHQHVQANSGLTIEKNWSPFLYENKLHFVYSLQPLRILAITSVDKSDVNVSGNRKVGVGTATLSLLSMTKCNFETWLWGQPRGGTPWLLVKGGVLLSFFHSRNKLPGSKMETYWMGAMTMSASPPFKILKISKTPMLLDSWYQGPWCGFRHIDYIVYPMGFFVGPSDDGDDSSGSGGSDVITLSLGRNDNEGYVVKIDLTVLMSSLRPITCSST